MRPSPRDGKTIAFTSFVYPDCKDDDCNSKRDAEKEKNKVKAHLAEHLLYRHWDHWNDGKRSHLFVVPADGSAAPRNLTPGADYDVPPDQRGDSGDINFSPDSKEMCFTAVTDKMEAISTNGDLFTALMAFSPGFIPPGSEKKGKPRIFISHGTADNILPIASCSRRLVPELKQDGYPVTYREFDGPHTVPPEITAEAMRWFLS